MIFKIKRWISQRWISQKWKQWRLNRKVNKFRFDKW